MRRNLNWNGVDLFADLPQTVFTYFSEIGGERIPALDEWACVLAMSRQHKEPVT